MTKTIIPDSYDPSQGLQIFQTQEAIEKIKRRMEKGLSDALHLMRVSAPLFVDPTSGLNDDLNGVERAVVFDIAATKKLGAVVHSLAKWKRMALYKYEFHPGKGLYTDMNAIRRDEDMDNLHSIYVDQWDWELILKDGERTQAFLKETVKKIVNVICSVQNSLFADYPCLCRRLHPEVTFITTQELEDLYPDLSPKERENVFLREHKTVFLMQIGGVLRSGIRHDGRAPDYDDWALNGDLLFYNEILDCAFEVSSMGIRVNAESMKKQLEEAECMERAGMMFHQNVLNGTYPLTMGGGIGQSRVCMLLLEKAHIGEVQTSIWDKQTLTECAAHRVELL